MDPTESLREATAAWHDGYATARHAPGRPLTDIAVERTRQDAKFGELRDYADGTGCPGSAEAADLLRAVCKAGDTDGDTWAKILAEEVAEAFDETDLAALRRELVQVAAVAVAWIEGLDRRATGGESLPPSR